MTFVILAIAFLALVKNAHPAEDNVVEDNIASESSNVPLSIIDSSRIPRGTVYQIRPVNFQSGTTRASDPFGALDSIADIEFRKLAARVAAKGQSQSGESDAQASNPKVKVINVNVDSDTDGVEIPNFVLEAAVRGDDNDEEDKRSNAKRDYKPEESRPFAIETDEGLEEPWDASYAFGYTLEDQARHEVSDPDGNVRGYYTYVDDMGFVRKVVYQAGAETGYVVLSQDKVKGPIRLSPPRKIIPKVPLGGWRPEGLTPSPPPPLPPPPPSPPPRPSSTPIQRPMRVRPSYVHVPAESGYPGAGSNSWSSQGRPRRPIFVVKIRRPVERMRPEEDDGQYRAEPSEDNGAWDGDIGEGPRFVREKELRTEQSRNEPRQDASYTFGYETGDANRLEKADSSGNIRGSYSYIDDEGVKRTVHYIAGAGTGFQVIGRSSSPTAPRSIRLEAPRGFMVTRRQPSKSKPSLTNVETEYPSPNVVVYHIHPDKDNPTNFPWWQALGLSRRPRPRRIMRVQRPMPSRFEPIIEQTNNDYQIGSTEASLASSTTKPAPPVDNLDNSVPQSDGLTPSVATSSQRPSGPPMYFVRMPASAPPPLEREGPILEREGPIRPFRHSTRVRLENADMNSYFIRRRRPRPSHRAFTQNSVESESDEGVEENETPNNNPVLYYPTRRPGRGRRIPVPDPIILQPSRSRVLVRNRGTRLDFAESNVYPVHSTPSPSSPEDNFIVTPTSDQTEDFAAGNLDSEPKHETSTTKSTEITISSSTTRIPYIPAPNADEDTPAVEDYPENKNPTPEIVPVVETQSEEPEPEVPTPPPYLPLEESTPTEESIIPPSSTSIPISSILNPIPRGDGDTLALTDGQLEHVLMTNSERLMQRLGRELAQGGSTSASN